DCRCPGNALGGAAQVRLTRGDEMPLLENLRAMGNRLGLINIVTLKDPSAETPKVTTRSMTLDQLASEVSHAEMRALAELPAELSVGFDKVFDAAGIKPPPHGWSVVKLGATLLEE